MQQQRAVAIPEGGRDQGIGHAAANQRRAITSRQGWETLRRLSRNRGATIGGCIVLALIVIAVLAEVLAPYPPTKSNPLDAMQPPGLNHWMGTDEIGRDILSRVIVGARISLQVGFVASAISMIFGTLLGLFVGYRGGWVDTAVMRIVDVMLAVPMPLFALTVVAGLGPSMVNVMLAIGIAGTPRFTRVIRGSVLSAKEGMYIEAARVTGCGSSRIALVHILPNVVAPAFVLATLNIGNAILIGATLSFLGLGAQPPTPEWGLILSQGRNYLRYAWWISTFPGLAIVITVLSINMLGDGLRDALDPRLRQSG
jgi:peptide/nickel transport system permease protein